MAPNRPSHQDEPTEEVEDSSEEEVDGEDEEESGSESEEPKPPKAAPIHVAEMKPPPKKPDSATVPQSKSESEEPEPPKAAPTPVAEKKPPTKKPDSAESESQEPLKKPDSAMEETPKTKKPRSKALATPRPAARAGSKRPIESDPKDSKRPKKKKIADPKKLFERICIDDDEMTILFESICSDDDDRTILEGVIDYCTKKKEVNSYHLMVDFHDFIKKSLKADVNKTQMQDKIRRLKKKYETYVAKGKKYNPVKTHELKVLGSIAISGLSEQYKCNETSAGLRELELLRGSLELIGEPKRTELKEEWKKLHVAELELVRRGELMREQAKLEAVLAVSQGSRG